MSEDNIRELDVIASLLSTLAKLDLAGEGTDESPTKNALMRESVNEWRQNSLPLSAALRNYKARINMARKMSKTPEQPNNLLLLLITIRNHYFDHLSVYYSSFSSE